MRTNRLLILCAAALICVGTAFTQSQSTPTPNAEQQTTLQSAMKDLKMRRQALQSAATAKMSLVNCGQLALAQSQLETADARMQLALTKVANQLGLEAGSYEAIEDKDGNIRFHRKQPSPSPSPIEVQNGQNAKNNQENHN